MRDAEVKNALIDSVHLDDGDRGLLTATLFMNYGGASQGFGGYSLYLPKSFNHHKLMSVAGHFIWRCMEIGDVRKWEQLKGKAVRVRTEDGLIKGIGHITKEDWFYPSVDFASIE